VNACINHGSVPYQVALERFVDSDTVNVGVIHEPNDLVTKQLSIVLRRQVGLSGLRRVELKTLSNTLTKDIEGRVGLLVVRVENQKVSFCTQNSEHLKNSVGS
jgi:hypothetical protein